MKKIISALMILALMILPNICGAKAAFHPETVKGEYNIVFPEFDPIDNSQIPIYAKITTTFNNVMDEYWRSVHFNDNFVSSTMNYEITCDTDDILSIIFTVTMHSKGGIYDKDINGNDIPFTYKRVVNFDMHTGDEIESENLKNISPKYNFTSQDVIKKLKAYAKKNNFKLNPEIENLNIMPQRYYIDKNMNVHFLFMSYEISNELRYIDFADIDMSK